MIQILKQNPSVLIKLIPDEKAKTIGKYSKRASTRSKSPLEIYSNNPPPIKPKHWIVRTSNLSKWAEAKTPKAQKPQTAI